ncbi:MAG: transposase family [Geobacteraceae bacterium]|nr:MAG: transposase family [Geobacteraceae bacterium]
MKPEELIDHILGIAPAWKVTGVTFSRESDRLDITIDFQRGASLPCPVCGASAPVHDTSEEEWRNLNFIQYEAYLHVKVPHVKCPNDGCGLKQVQVPWARAGSGFTRIDKNVPQNPPIKNASCA